MDANPRTPVHRSVCSKLKKTRKVIRIPLKKGGPHPFPTIPAGTLDRCIPSENWGEYLDDHLGATAIIDRLLHHSCVIVINGPSYRDRVHRQETEKSSKAQ